VSRLQNCIKGSDILSNEIVFALDVVSKHCSEFQKFWCPLRINSQSFVSVNAGTASSNRLRSVPPTISEFSTVPIVPNLKLQNLCSYYVFKYVTNRIRHWKLWRQSPWFARHNTNCASQGQYFLSADKQQISDRNKSAASTNTRHVVHCAQVCLSVHRPEQAPVLRPGPSWNKL